MPVRQRIVAGLVGILLLVPMVFAQVDGRARPFQRCVRPSVAVRIGKMAACMHLDAPSSTAESPRSS